MFVSSSYSFLLLLLVLLQAREQGSRAEAEREREESEVWFTPNTWPLLISAGGVPWDYGYALFYLQIKGLTLSVEGKQIKIVPHVAFLFT